MAAESAALSIAEVPGTSPTDSSQRASLSNAFVQLREAVTSSTHEDSPSERAADFPTSTTEHRTPSTLEALREQYGIGIRGALLEGRVEVSNITSVLLHEALAGLVSDATDGLVRVRGVAFEDSTFVAHIYADMLSAEPREPTNAEAPGRMNERCAPVDGGNHRGSPDIDIVEAALDGPLGRMHESVGDRYAGMCSEEDLTLNVPNTFVDVVVTAHGPVIEISVSTHGLLTGAAWSMFRDELLALATAKLSRFGLPVHAGPNGLSLDVNEVLRSELVRGFVAAQVGGESSQQSGEDQGPAQPASADLAAPPSLAQRLRGVVGGASSLADRLRATPNDPEAIARLIDLWVVDDVVLDGSRGSLVVLFHLTTDG